MIDNAKNNLPLDLSYLREMSGDNTEFMLEMLDAFLEQIPLYMADLGKAIEAKDWKATSEFAHKIKPTFYYVGREDARDQVQEIEINAREVKNVDQILSSFNEIKEFIDVLFKQINETKATLVA